MKILYITNIRIPTEKAHGVQVMKTCEALAAAGMEVELIISTKGHKFTKHLDPYEFYGVKNNFLIRRVASLDPYWFMSLPGGWYIKFQALFYNMSLFFYLLFRTDKKDSIIYTRDEILLPLLQLFSRQVVWEGHNLPTRRGYYKKFWQRCYKVFVLTSGLKEAMIRLGVPQQKISIIPDAVDLKIFLTTDSKTSLRQSFNLPLDKKIIMYTGHLYDWKGAHTILDAAEYFQVYLKNSEDWLFVFVGGTDADVARFRQEVLERKIRNVLVLGHRPHHEIPRWLKCADVVVLPNTSETKISRLYTSPMKLFEYMASGIPMAASDLPSLREVVNEETAAFFEPGNAQDLVLLLQQMFEQPEMFEKKAKAAQVEVRQYTWDERAKKIVRQLAI